MKNNNKKGFSLAEMLIVFLLISIMLTVFAPVMTKKAKKKTDPNCPSGIKNVAAEYTVPGVHPFSVPENIVGDLTVTLVGPGGQGASYETGGQGGQGGEYKKVSVSKDNATEITVGAGGGKSGYGNTTFGGETALAGASGFMPDGAGGGMRNALKLDEVYGKGGAAGDVCPEASCNPHGKAGSGYQGGMSEIGFIAGTGGGGGGYDGATETNGLGGFGGDGYAKIEYSIDCTQKISGES